MFTTRYLLALAMCTLASGASFTLTQDKANVRPGESATITSSGGSDTVSWTLTPKDKGTLSATSGAAVTFTAPSRFTSCFQVAITATSGSDSSTVYVGVVAASNDEPQESCAGGSIVTSVVGFSQSGGSSSDGAQKFFFDFFQLYPLARLGTWANEAVYGPQLHWWGDVRISSYPQQVTAQVSQFDIATAVGNLPVNQLAQFGEFRTGLDLRVAGFKFPFLPTPGASSERTSIGVFGGFGAQGSLTSPTAVAEVFNLPPVNTPQATAFNAAFPASAYPILASPGVQYVAFTPPDRDRFFWQYAAGVRLTTRYFDPSGKLLGAPALLSVSFGQNELVTGGTRQGIVGTFEGFYPLTIPGTQKVGVLYLFGRADLRLGGPSALTTPIALTPATTTVNGTSTAVPVTNPNVAIIALPSNRDRYSIGIGIDAVQVFQGLLAKTKGN